MSFCFSLRPLSFFQAQQQNVFSLGLVYWNMGGILGGIVQRHLENNPPPPRPRFKASTHRQVRSQTRTRVFVIVEEQRGPVLRDTSHKALPFPFLKLLDFRK